MVTEVKIEHWDQNYNVKLCRPHKATFPDTHRHFRPATDSPGNVPSFARVQGSTTATKKKNMLGYATYG